MANNQIIAISNIQDCNDFWQLWQQYRDYLYRCCLKWMGGNPIAAEDALSRAMFKAWEKVQQYAGKITNFKAWLTRLTHNLCVDIHRERKRSANRVKDIEAISEEKGLFFCEDTPLKALESSEKNIAIQRAINELPKRLYETFILRFYQELSCHEIAQRLGLTIDNVYKRIQEARKILQRYLSRYLSGSDKSVLDVSDSFYKNTSRVIENLSLEKRIVSDSKEAMNMEIVSEIISYEVSATCLENIPQNYYHSLSLLGWS